MKTSFLLIMALFKNTTLLLAEPVSELLESISIWPFIVLEIFLFLGYYLHKTFHDFRKETNPDFRSLNIFVVNGSSEIDSKSPSADQGSS